MHSKVPPDLKHGEGAPPQAEQGVRSPDTAGHRPGPTGADHQRTRRVRRASRLVHLQGPAHACVEREGPMSQGGMKNEGLFKREATVRPERSVGARGTDDGQTCRMY